MSWWHREMGGASYRRADAAGRGAGGVGGAVVKWRMDGTRTGRRRKCPHTQLSPPYTGGDGGTIVVMQKCLRCDVVLVVDEVKLERVRPG